MKSTVLTFVFVGIFGSAALGWEEVTVDLKDPDIPVVGTVESGQVEGYFCSDRFSAEILAKYFSGVQTPKEELVIGLRQCVPDVRHVAGVFPEGKYTVAYVRDLSDMMPSYLVRGLLADMRIQEARATTTSSSDPE